MIPRADLESTARSYMRAAKILNRPAHGSHDAAAYLCGCAVEIALKARICRTLGWPGCPETSAEFQNYRSFQTHDLNVLLHLAGQRVEDRIRTKRLADWTKIQSWKPERRYQPVGTTTAADATRMIQGADAVLRAIL